jgi:hypothetical protein
MIGITLSSEQIRTAPTEVRQWIEHEVMASFGQQAPLPAEAKESQSGHLEACSEQEAAAILSQIQDVLPAVNVFFEFGRQGALVGQRNIEAYRLLDIARHTRLQNVAQVVACLEIINAAFARVRGDATGTFCAFDRDGHCFIAPQTQQSIMHLWQKVVASHQPTLDAREEFEPASVPDGRLAMGEPFTAFPPLVS